jgi:sarcosine oxidase delta subunit
MGTGESGLPWPKSRPPWRDRCPGRSRTHADPRRKGGSAMSDYEYRNKTFDYAPPSRAGSAGGLLFVGGIILLFIVGMHADPHLPLLRRLRPRDGTRPRRRGASEALRPRLLRRRFRGYLFLRPNPKGVHFERWRHAMAAASGSTPRADTATLEVFGTYPAQTTEPPADIVAAIKAKRPWSWRDRHEHASGHGGRLIDRSRQGGVHLQRQALRGHPGDTLASALWPTARCWWAGPSSITARAASWPAAPKSPTRW